jgi:hypothetical protein
MVMFVEDQVGGMWGGARLEVRTWRLRHVEPKMRLMNTKGDPMAEWRGAADMDVNGTPASPQGCSADRPVLTGHLDMEHMYDLWSYRHHTGYRWCI